MSSITVRKDLRGRFGPVRDQEARPTCLAFAASDTHAATREPWAELCCEYLFYSAKKHDKTPPQRGARMSSIRHVLECVGQPVETVWAYLKKLPNDLKQWKPPPVVGQLYTCSSKDAGSGFDEAWAAIMSDSPALIGMTTSLAFNRWDTEGVIDANEPIVPQRRHAVIGVAVGERKGRRLLMIRNSWGNTWGLSGYAWLAERYASPRIQVVVTLH
ncbi:MAG TPA: C1 family peptidase [Gemmataceae bacterium]|jgi:hypothetical protein